MIINLYILVAVLTFLLLVAILKITKFKVINKILTYQNNELSGHIQLLEQQRLDNIKQIEHLTSKIEYLDKEIANKSKTSGEVIDSAKAALFELGKELSTQLIALHKQENQDAKNTAKENIEQVTKAFEGELEKLVAKINVLGNYIQESNTTFDAIKNSLLSSVHAGNFAETTLENVLLASGLVRNKDFILQTTINDELNNKLRPDALIFLPNDICVIVDAKSSKFLFQEDNDANLMKSINQHLKNLSSKEYARLVQENYKTQHVITLMFLPTESTIDKIMNIDSSFLSKAWHLNIFPVGPTSLINMLLLIKLQINQHMREENYKEIFEEVTKLIASLATVIQNCHKLGANIQTLVNNYDKFVSHFNSQFLAKTKNIVKLGINSNSVITPLDRYQLITSKNELIE